MRTVKFLLIFVSLTIYLILGYLLRLVLIGANPYRTLRAVNRLTYYLMHTFILVGNIKVTVLGQKDLLKERSLFIISTHMGYLDGVILGTLVPGSFATKSEIRHIPFLGQVVSAGGSIFIDRHKKNNIVKYIKCMTDRLENNINVFNFPEGHATDGAKILPFFSSFFDAPLRARSTIAPITINYAKVNGSTDFNRDEVYCYDGKVSIIKHLWNVLKFKSIEVIVTVHDKIPYNGDKTSSKSRKSISDLCMQRLSSYTNLPISEELAFSGKN